MVKLKEEEDNWQKKLQTLEEDESKLDEIVTNLPVVGIGDSVLLGAVNNLYNRDIIPKHTIISGYRDPKSNICTKGATHSKHIHNNAIDILISNKDIKYIQTVCTFWKKQGSKYNMGLGTYKQNFQGQKYTILHIDTSSYRTWGNNYKSNTSLCL